MTRALPTIRIALFGASAAGKTTLVSSYFGYQQRHAFEKVHGYRLSASDPRDGHLMLKNYYGMQDGHFPPATVLRDHTYRFEFKLSGLPQPAFLLEWLDYPGAWWENSPTDPEEQAAQRDCILRLLDSQVGFVLIDGAEYRDKGPSYLGRQLDHFKNEVRRWQDVVAEKGHRLPIIEEWIIALTKADLFPESYTAEQFGRDVIQRAVEPLNGLVEAMGSHRLGKRFMLLSSAQVDANDRQRVRSVDQTLGLELIAPAAFHLVLAQIAEERARARPQEKLPWWQRLLLAVAELAGEGQLERSINQRYQPLLDLIRALGKLAQFDVERRAEEYRAEQKKAVAEGDLMRAAAAAMSAELRGEAARRAFFIAQE